MRFYASKTAAAQCVEDLLNRSDIDWQSITITKQGKSEVLSVHIATDMSLEDTARALEQYFSETHMSTSSKATPDG